MVAIDRSRVGLDFAFSVIRRIRKCNRKYLTMQELVYVLDEVCASVDAV